MAAKIGSVPVPKIGFGLMSLGHAYGFAGTDEERFKILDHAVSIGATHWDTADIYGDCEDVLGKWFKRDPANRSKVFLATKFGFVVEDRKTFKMRVDGTPEYVKQACEKSLQRMGIDKIDLYYLHRADKNVPIEKTVGAMAELVKEGKVAYLGLSEVSAETLKRAQAVHPISAFQVEYSPYYLDIESSKIGLKSACEESGIAIIAYSPVGRGLLTGQIKSWDDFPQDDLRRIFPKFQQENFPHILKLTSVLEELAKKYDNTSPTQICLAWLAAQGTEKSPVIPIPGTRKIKYLDENHAASAIKLSQEDAEKVRKAAKEVEDAIADQARYPPGMEDVSYVNTPPL